MIWGTFLYKRTAGKAFAVEVTVEQTHSGLSIACPTCGKRSRLGESHRVTKSKNRDFVSIDRPVLCPNSQCGWFVRVHRGRAYDTVAGEDFAPRREDIPATAAVEGRAGRQPRGCRLKPRDANKKLRADVPDYAFPPTGVVRLPGSPLKENLTLKTISGAERRRIAERDALPPEVRAASIRVSQSIKFKSPGPTLDDVAAFSEGA